MSIKSVHVAVLVLVSCASATVWAAGDAEKAFQQAQQLVAKGDLLAAKKALVIAVKAERSNQKYLQQYLLVSQAIKLQAAVKTQKDPQALGVGSTIIKSVLHIARPPCSSGACGRSDIQAVTDRRRRGATCGNANGVEGI